MWLGSDFFRSKLNVDVWNNNWEKTLPLCHQCRSTRHIHIVGGMCGKVTGKGPVAWWKSPCTQVQTCGHAHQLQVCDAIFRFPWTPLSVPPVVLACSVICYQNKLLSPTNVLCTNWRMVAHGWSPYVCMWRWGYDDWLLCVHSITPHNLGKTKCCQYCLFFLNSTHLEKF